MVITPPIITSVRMITNHFSKRRLGGKASEGSVSDIITFQIGPDPAPRLDKALARDVPEGAHLSRTRLMRLVEEGAVCVNETAITNPKARVTEGDQITIAMPESREVETIAQEIPVEVVYEDEALLVVNKPAGMVVHPAPGTPDGTLVNALLAHCGDSLSGVGGEKRPGIVHRIDKDTSGLLVVAKSDAAHHGLAAQFEAHSVHRRYLALCHGIPDAADPRLRGLRGVSFEQGGILKLTTQLTRHKTDRQKQAVVFANGRHAVTRARVLQSAGDVALLECWLETGRTHQIRVHLAYAGHSLIGDPVYGGKRKLKRDQAGRDALEAFNRQALHAAELGFVHPITDETLHFDAPLPADMHSLCAALGL